MSLYHQDKRAPLATGPFISPRLRLVVGLLALTSVTLLSGGALSYYVNSANLNVGYAPLQPVEFSHKLHAGDLGLDCRFCHFNVERSAFAGLPSTQICMKCHSKVRSDSVKLLPVRATYAADQPIIWRRVHKLPDHVYFDHSIHGAAGLDCAACHGRVEQMQRVEQTQPLSMGWCIDCHRHPTTTLSSRTLSPPTHCSGCHR
jgi:hypothetical protein